MTPELHRPHDVPRSGRLEVLPLPNLLYRLHREKATGRLTLEGTSQRHTVDLAAGRPAAVTLGTGSVEPLGRILLELGRLSDADHEASLALLAQQRRLHGEILREMGVVTEADVVLGLQIQLRRKLARLFHLHEGTFRFETSAEVVTPIPPVDPLPVILQGIRGAYDDARLDDVLTPLVGLEVRLRGDPLDDLDLSDAERKLLAAMREFRPLSELTSGTLLPPLEARMLLAFLVFTEALDVRDEVLAWRDTIPGARVGTPPAETRGARREAAQAPEPQRQTRPAESPAADTPRAEPERTGTRPPEGRPPEGRAPEGRPPEGPRPETPSPEVPRRQTRPARSATAETPRAEPERTGTRPADGRPPESPVPPPAGPEVARRATGAGRPQPARSASELLKRIEKKAGKRQRPDEDIVALLTRKEEQIRSSDFFALLEVGREAKPDELRQAYFRLAKSFHPDRFLSEKLKGLRRRAEAVFVRISEAYDTLRSEERRQEYLALLADDRARGDRKRAQMASQADSQFRVAEELMSRGELDRAEEVLRKAIELFPDGADFHAALGWLTYQNPKTPAGARFSAAMKHLLKALSAQPDCERAHLALGKIYETEGQPAEAVRHYEKVLATNPRHPEAAAALARLRPAQSRER